MSRHSFIDILLVCSVVWFGTAQHTWSMPFTSTRKSISAQRTRYLEIWAYDSVRNLNMLDLIGRFFEKTRISGWYWFSTLILLVTPSPFSHKRSRDVARCGRALSYIVKSSENLHMTKFPNRHLSIATYIRYSHEYVLTYVCMAHMCNCSSVHRFSTTTTSLILRLENSSLR